MGKKIDRPLVRMTRTKDDGGYDYYWYKTMMGKQSQINTLLREQIEILGSHVETLQTHKGILEKDVESLENKIFVFRPWKLFKKKKKNVGN
jgi:hypothetical protein